MKVYKILTITRSPLNSNDNLGSTLEKILGNNECIELHNVYLRSEKYNNDICKSVYQIPEQKLLRSFFTRKQIGEELQLTQKVPNFDSRDKKEDRVYNFFKRFSFYFPWLCREMMWSLGRWKNKSFESYLKKVNPDFIFFVSFNSWYPYKVLKYIQSVIPAKTIVYHVDDNYSLNQFHISPFYWIYRFKLRKCVKNTSKIASINYCISLAQKEAYDNYFGIDCKLLQKTASFLKNEKEISCPIKIVFTGNISSGRWKTLSLVGKALDEINKNHELAYLEIYTQTALTKKISKALKCSSVKKVEQAFSNEIPSIQLSADMLLHVESFEKKDINSVKLSFSTKIVDYVSRCRAILAVGPFDVASIKYFIENGTGFYICDKFNIQQRLLEIFNNRTAIKEMATKSFDKGFQMHDQTAVISRLIDDLKSIQ